jgi:hypothetical protein
MEQMVPVRSGRVTVVGGGALVALALLTAGALAASPINGASYRGALHGSRAKIAISFRVSTNGSQVQALRISALPIYCGGSGPPGTPTINFQIAKISARGTFSSSGKDLIGSGPAKGSVAATLRVSGSFAGGGKESGTITTIYGGSAAKCGGHSSYSTVTAPGHSRRAPAPTAPALPRVTRDG